MNIKTTVYKPADRKFYLVRWTDPVTGKVRRKTTGTSIRREAERFAAKLEEQLETDPIARGDVAWETFRRRCEEEYLAPLSKAHASTAALAMNAVEEYSSPKTLGAFTAEEVARVKLKLAERGCRPATVMSYMKTLRACLYWAKSVDLIGAVPKMRLSSRVHEQAKGRPLTLEEFERLLAAGEKLRGDSWASWERLLRGLWLSGLRLGEALNLRWDKDGAVGIDLTGKRPLFDIKAHASKNRKAQRFPMAPDFYRFLMETPEVERRGFVFDPLRKKDTGVGFGRITVPHASEAIAAMGWAAGIVVKRLGEKPVYASAHDLRRSFGFRWAKQVMPAILQKLMRHESLAITMTFYVTQTEEQTADAVWEADAARCQVTDSVTDDRKQLESPAKGERRSDLRGQTGVRSLSP